MPATLTIKPWPDPLLDTLGHDPRSSYVEKFWLPTLGPTSVRFGPPPSGQAGTSFRDCGCSVRVVSSVGPAQDNVQIGNALAPAWERHRERLFESFRSVSEWLVDQVAPSPGETILELAAGPGETGFLVAERVGDKGRLISTDLAPAMVDVARRGAQTRGLDNVEFRVMDAQQIDLPDASVDGVLSRFGVMLTPEPDRVLNEARRVLRPGGRLAYAVMGAPDRNPWMALFLGSVMQSGHAPPGDPVGPGSPFSLADPERNRALLGAAGFADIQIEEIAGIVRYESFEDYWSFQSSVAGPIALLIALLPSEDVEEIRTALEPTLSPFRSGSAYDIPALAIG